MLHVLLAAHVLLVVLLERITYCANPRRPVQLAAIVVF